MMDVTWGEVARIAGGGFGLTILVLIILSVVIWVVVLIIQKTQARGEKTE